MLYYIIIVIIIFIIIIILNNNIIIIDMWVLCMSVVMPDCGAIIYRNQTR